jgi:hypothetical protein
MLLDNERVAAEVFNLGSLCLASGHIVATVTYGGWDRDWVGPRRGLVALTKKSIFAPVRRESSQ